MKWKNLSFFCVVCCSFERQRVIKKTRQTQSELDYFCFSFSFNFALFLLFSILTTDFHSFTSCFIGLQANVAETNIEMNTMQTVFDDDDDDDTDHPINGDLVISKK